MTLLDIVVAIPLLFFVLRGWKHGIVREGATLVGIVVGIWASVHLSQQVAEWLGLEGEWSVIAAFFVCFVGSLVLAYLVGGMVEKAMKDAHLGLLNKASGAAVGLVKASCIVAVILANIVNLDQREVLIKPSVKEESVLYAPVAALGSWFTASMKDYIEEHRDSWVDGLKGGDE